MEPGYNKGINKKNFHRNLHYANSLGKLVRGNQLGGWFFRICFYFEGSLG